MSVAIEPLEAGRGAAADFGVGGGTQTKRRKIHKLARVRHNNKIIIIIGLRSVSASEDVIGDPSRSGTNNDVLLDPRREEREKVMRKADQFPF